jgi:hypothetical protein
LTLAPLCIYPFRIELLIFSIQSAEPFLLGDLCGSFHEVQMKDRVKPSSGNGGGGGEGGGGFDGVLGASRGRREKFILDFTAVDPFPACLPYHRRIGAQASLR